MTLVATTDSTRVLMENLSYRIECPHNPTGIQWQMVNRPTQEQDGSPCPSGWNRCLVLASWWSFNQRRDDALTNEQICIHPPPSIHKTHTSPTRLLVALTKWSPNMLVSSTCYLFLLLLVERFCHHTPGGLVWLGDLKQGDRTPFNKGRDYTTHVLRGCLFASLFLLVRGSWWWRLRLYCYEDLTLDIFTAYWQ